MKVFVGKFYLFLLLVFLLGGCKERFNPELKDTNARLLVVEGMISVGGERTSIKLSRTVPVSQKGNRVPEVGATVSFESSANQTYTLTESSPGTYQSAVLNLDPNLKYRLKIVSKGVEYITDFLEAKLSPPIDDVAWKEKGNGLEINVSTHDDAKKTRYYRWDFDETWVFYSQYASTLIWTGNGLRLRDPVTENIYQCWGSAGSTNVNVGSTMKLSDDVIYQKPLILIPKGSERFSLKYSILVRQYALTKEAFEFWENLGKNTENLGSIFDAQPSELTGNIRNVKNPNEPVLGFISVGSIQSKRIFIAREQLDNWLVVKPSPCFQMDTVRTANIRNFANPEYMAIEEIYNGGGILIGYGGAPRRCVDCTIRGTNIKPSFWQ